MKKLFAYIPPLIFALLLSVLFMSGCMGPKDELLTAAAEGDAAKVQRLLKKGVGVNTRASGGNGATPLILAADGGHKEVVSILLGAGADPNIYFYDDGGMASAMLVAARQGSADIIRLLADAGVNPDFQAEDGITALMVAAKYGRKEAAAELLRAGAKPDLRTSEKGMTALMIAARHGHADAASVLLQAGAKPDLRLSESMDVKDYGKTARPVLRFEGLTALMIAAYNGHAEVVSLLLKAGADVNIKAADIDERAMLREKFSSDMDYKYSGDTVMSFALKGQGPDWKTEEVLKLLKEHGAKII